MKRQLLSLIALTTLAACSKTNYQISLPAHALSYNENSSGFVLHQRGINWSANAGKMSFTVHKPDNYDGEKVKLAVAYQFIDDNEGDIRFSVIPIDFDHNTSFETYGGVASDSQESPENPTYLFEQTIDVDPEHFTFPSGKDWWYFELGWDGSYDGRIRLMSVAISYL